MTQQTKGQTPETDELVERNFSELDWKKEYAEIVNHARKLETQRDSLLAALEGMVREFGFHCVHNGMVNDERMALLNAQEAISAVKEGK